MWQPSLSHTIQVINYYKLVLIITIINSVIIIIIIIIINHLLYKALRFLQALILKRNISKGL